MKFKRWCSNQVLEYWKDIQNYEGLYMVSSLGKIKSLERKVKCGNGFCTIKAKIREFSISSNGYLVVNLHKNGKRKMFYVHRLVANAFIPNLDNKPCIDHIDTDRLNNSIKNLRWCTHKENMNNPLSLKKKSEGLKEHYANMTEEKRKEITKKMGEIRKGKKHSEKTKEKMSEKKQGEKNPKARKVKCHTGEIFATLTEAGEWCGTHRSCIAGQIRGKRKSAGKHPETGEKLHWEYVIEQEISLDLNILIDNINISL